MNTNLDILAVSVHPDDVELACSGTLLRHIAQGYRCGILDLSRGELGTRGSAEIRAKEAARAAEILGVAVRENLDLPDGFFRNDRESQLRIIEIIRKYRPKIVLCNAVYDRHPDHGRASGLVSESCFYSGLVKIETVHNGVKQDCWRPQAVYHYIQDRHIKPDIVVDITDFAEKKMEAIRAFASQFYNPDSKEPATPISGLEFMEAVKARMILTGREIGVKYGEGFTVERSPGVPDLFLLT
ncbi:MAG: LmbE family protein [Bacteroidetes bacterium]|nr:MAG: LmbE family protein [Bacteroidota bacterium]